MNGTGDRTVGRKENKEKRVSKGGERMGIRREKRGKTVKKNGVSTLGERSGKRKRRMEGKAKKKVKRQREGK